jgi:hypothetical protein
MTSVSSHVSLTPRSYQLEAVEAVVTAQARGV